MIPVTIHVVTLAINIMNKNIYCNNYEQVRVHNGATSKQGYKAILKTGNRFMRKKTREYDKSFQSLLLNSTFFLVLAQP